MFDAEVAATGGVGSCRGDAPGEGERDGAGEGTGDGTGDLGSGLA